MTSNVTDTDRPKSRDFAPLRRLFGFLIPYRMRLVLASIALLLAAAAVLAFGWVFMRTGGVFLATWSFFLVQALWVAIPTRIGGNKAARAPGGNDRFDRARRQADEALRQLYSR